MYKTIKVEGMTCDHCRMAVEKAAKSVEGVADASVDLKKAELSVSFKDDSAGGSNENLEAVKAAVTDAGYTPV